MTRTNTIWTIGFSTGTVAVDLLDSPAMRVCVAMHGLFLEDVAIGTTITMSIDPEGPTDMTVRMLRSHRRGSRAAGDAMSILTRLCDRHGVTLRLQSVSLAAPGDDSLDQDALDAFYARRGFVPDDANWRAYAMIRRPSAVVAAPLARAA